MEGEVITLMQK
ncbi:Protein of unknown function [Bacillus wiedmannii]|uniref:Uncharacterized protein n=1 Tax=Bacillus wiedmannii TaxID=1890302 RepID=A0A1C4AUC5_9BACI|nr:Protein of unknown function [Bacillus wiedmannii]